MLVREERHMQQQCSAVQCSAVQCRAVRCSAVQGSAMQRVTHLQPFTGAQPYPSASSQSNGFPRLLESPTAVRWSTVTPSQWNSSTPMMLSATAKREKVVESVLWRNMLGGGGEGQAETKAG